MAYSQPAAKRQKARERVDQDNFQGIDKIEYNNMASPADAGTYRYYNSTERIHSRTMEDWLKFSVSLTEFRTYSNDSITKSFLRPWDDGTNTIENNKRCIKALFDLCLKLGIKYWTAFDSDLVPWTENWDEARGHWDDMVEYVVELSQRSHVRLLWLAPDLHSHPRYASGALTSHDATVFTQAATQIKKCLEMSQRMNAECFLLWPYREGYDSIFQTNVVREIKLFAKLLKLTSEYKERLNYRCQLLIMPYYNGSFGRNKTWQHCWWEKEMVNMYMWDVTSCLYFLKNYNLERHYKVCLPPGHHLYLANVYNMLGGVFITNKFDHYDTRTLTLMMKCIIDQGTAPPGGIHLKLRHHREGDSRELLAAFAKFVEAGARALRLAATVAADQMFSKHLQQRYSSYYSGFGSRLVNSDVTMEECEEYYKKNHAAHSDVTATKVEQLDIAFQRYIDTCEHI